VHNHIYNSNSQSIGIQYPPGGTVQHSGEQVTKHSLSASYFVANKTRWPFRYHSISRWTCINASTDYHFSCIVDLVNVKVCWHGLEKERSAVATQRTLAENTVSVTAW